MRDPIELLFLVVGVWWLAIMPGIFVIATFDAISDWIEEKARELRRKN